MDFTLIIQNVNAVFKGEANKGTVIGNYPRQWDGFVLFTEGAADYIFDDRTLGVKENSLLYLPKGSIYSIDVKSPCKYICIDFYIAPKAEMPKGFAIENAGITLNEKFSKAFHCWMKQDVSSNAKIFSLLYDIYATALEAEHKTYTKSSQLYARAVELILLHYNQPELSVEWVSRELKVSAVHLRRIFLKHSNSSPIKYINHIRLEQAKKLLQFSNLTIGEIALSVGYTDALYFSRIFKNHLGLSPTEYKKYIG